MKKFLRRHSFRLVGAGLGLLVCLQAAAALARGEPEYTNHYHQWVSSYVGLAAGALVFFVSILPWPDRKKRKTRGRGITGRSVRKVVEKRLPGRNEACHCGSGKKYKKCCLREDRQASLSRQSAGLNHSFGVKSLSAMVNRGLRAR